jgi:hypothetical protein
LINFYFITEDKEDEDYSLLLDPAEMSAKFRAINQSGLRVGIENEVRSRSDEDFPQFTENELKNVNLKGAKGKRVKMPFCKYNAAKFENYARRKSDPGSDAAGYEQYDIPRSRKVVQPGSLHARGFGEIYLPDGDHEYDIPSSIRVVLQEKL